MVTKGLVFGLQHFSIDDGDGIRSTVFLKGCPLKCLWCHNPEGLAGDRQLQYRKNRCSNCFKCVSACPQHAHHLIENIHQVDFQKCRQCGRCVNVCPQKALEITGVWMEPVEIVREVLQDQIYFKESGGGITVSGGEPMQQPDFLFELLKLCKENGLSTALETSGFGRGADYQRMVPYIDQFLWDYKHTDPQLHRHYIGVGNELILHNLDLVYWLRGRILLRCPLIPGVNDSKEHFMGIAAMIRKYPNLQGYEIMPYHKLGLSKTEPLGYEPQDLYTVPDEDMIRSWDDQIKKYINQ